MKQADNADRRSTAKSWLAVLVLATVIFGLLYWWVAPLFTSGRLAGWFLDIAVDPNRPSLIVYSVLMLVLTILLSLRTDSDAVHEEWREKR